MNTFELYCPDPLTRFDLTSDPEAEIARLVDPFVRSAPLTRQPIVRELMDGRVKPSLLDLAAAGASCVLMSVNPWDTSPVRPVIAFTPLDIDAPGPEVLAALQELGAEDPTADVVDLDGLVALRMTSSTDITERFNAAFAPVQERLAAAEPVPPAPVVTGIDEIPALAPVFDDEAPTVHTVGVQYVFGDPSECRSTPWMSAQLSFEHPSGAEGEDLARSWTAIFDMMMTTFRWTA